MCQAVEDAVEDAVVAAECADAADDGAEDAGDVVSAADDVGGAAERDVTVNAADDATVDADWLLLLMQLRMMLVAVWDAVVAGDAVAAESAVTVDAAEDATVDAECVVASDAAEDAGNAI